MALMTGVKMFLVSFSIAAVIGIAGAHAGESEALAISANIQARHLPFGTILDPIFASPANDQIVGYTRCGDSAIWSAPTRYSVSSRSGAT